MKFIGFYTLPPFWAVEGINLDDPAITDKFTELMSERVFSHDSALFNLRVCRDGMIMLRVTELEKVIEGSKNKTDELLTLWARYLDYLNSLYLLLDSSFSQVMRHVFLDVQPLTNRDAFRVMEQNRRLGPIQICTQSYARDFQMGRYLSLYPQGLPFKIDHRLLMRSVTAERKVFEVLVKQFQAVMLDASLIRRLSTIAKSLGEYKLGNYSTSLILAWFTIEEILMEKWKKFLESKNTIFQDGSARFNSDRTKFLEGRDYPVSVVSNQLEMSDVISFKTFRRIDKARNFRNRIVHQDPKYICKSKHAVDAIVLAMVLSTEGKSIGIVPNFSFSVSGL